MNRGYINTIAAIATAPGEGAIAIVRVSGPESLVIADRLFKGHGPPPSLCASHTFHHGTILNQSGVADEVILLIYRAPASYTREDVVEFQGHGGTAAAQRILRSILEAGARTAEPGEFTKRAFLNGRIDLIQAEAVIDLIRSRSDRSAQAALEQLSGELSRSFNALYDATLTLAGALECSLDFQEDELPESFVSDTRQQLSELLASVGSLISSWNEGHLLREGASIVILGRPNVGKSTLMNALLGKNRAIVTHLPGTTRDTIEEHLVIDGYTVNIIDTAGIRESECEIESEGIRRAIDKSTNSDLVIFVIDGSAPISREDLALLDKLDNSHTIIVANKADISINETIRTLEPKWSLTNLSATQKTGLRQLREAIVAMLKDGDATPCRTCISERHRALLIVARQEITEANNCIERRDRDVSLVAAHLRVALEKIGEATGRTYHDELLDNIFSRFCIGK